jgi:hypothetical protein
VRVLFIKMINKGQFTTGHQPNRHSFGKGNVPWNKGLKGYKASPATEFKKGVTTMENHPSWKGGIQRMSTGEIYVAVATNQRVRQSRLVYEKYYGTIPFGYVIYHNDKNPSNNKIENLEAISRGELAIRNRLGT